MNETMKCARCGAPTLGPDPLGGLSNLCPRCVLGFAMDDATLPVAAEGPGLKRGATLGNYEIIETLGRGGMGVVYRARHIGLDREVALKVLTPANAADAEFVERFRREAKTLASLSHPNIVQIHDSGFVGDVAYLAMEFVDGVNLRQLIAEKRLPPEEALLIVPQLCDALEYAHSAGIVHRDIKPENILLDKAGRVKIADFGLAKIVRGAMTQHQGLTHTNVTMGTPHYMAPEQVENTSTVDHRADIFSMGVVFYEMLTGELPIGRFGLPSRRPGVNSRLDQIVLKALENKPADRYQRASHVKDAISRMGSPGAMVVIGPDAPPPANPFYLITALFMVVIAFILFAFMASGRAVPPMIIASGLAVLAAGSFAWLARRRRETPARLPVSKMAVAGCILAVFSVGLPIVLESTGNYGHEFGCLLSGMLFIPALVLSICGIVAASTVKGARRGIGFGIAGTIICVSTLVIAPLLFLAKEKPSIAQTGPAPAPSPSLVECITIPAGFRFDYAPLRATHPVSIRRELSLIEQDAELYGLAQGQLPENYLSRMSFVGLFRGAVGKGTFEILGFETRGGVRIIVIPRTVAYPADQLKSLKDHFAAGVER